MSFTIDRIDHVVLNCRDVEASASWYERVLGFRTTWRRGDFAGLSRGGAVIMLGK